MAEVGRLRLYIPLTQMINGLLREPWGHYSAKLVRSLALLRMPWKQSPWCDCSMKFLLRYTIEVHNFAPVTSLSCWINFLINVFIKRTFSQQHSGYSRACHPIHPWKERGLKKSPDCGWTGLNDWVDLGWTSQGFKLKYNSPIKELNFTQVINE